MGGDNVQRRALTQSANDVPRGRRVSHKLLFAERKMPCCNSGQNGERKKGKKSLAVPLDYRRCTEEKGSNPLRPS